jgi:tetratricopeptide (TPR) repeat protein
MSGGGALTGLFIFLAVLVAGCASTYRSGQAALHEGRNVEAASLLTQALAEDPGRVEVMLALGIAHYRAGFFGSAIGPLGRAVLAQPDLAEARLYLALAYLAADDQGAAARQLKALVELNVHPRTAAQVRAALGLMEAGPLPTAVRQFVRRSLEDGIDWQHDVLEARLAPHMYLGPAWFIEDPTGWRPVGAAPYGVPRP